MNLFLAHRIFAFIYIYLHYHQAKGGAFELTKPTTLGGEADFVNCIFRNCEAVTEGGAIYSKGVGVDIQGSKFFDNKVTGTTGNGGAISADNGRVDIKTSKFIRNAAPQLGGGIYVYNSPHHNYILWNYKIHVLVTFTIFSNLSSPTSF